MAKKLVTKAEFAAIAGVSSAAITKASAPGKPLHKAMQGGMIDASHPVCVDYITSKQNTGPPVTIDGVDPLYDVAVRWCQENDIWKAVPLWEAGIGLTRDRARQVIKMIQASGIIPKPGVAPKPSPKPEDTRTNNMAGPPRVQPDNFVGVGASKAKMKMGSAQVDPDMLSLLPEDIRKLVDKTLRQLIQIFGTDTRFKDWLASVKAIEDIQAKRLSNAEKAGDLVARSLVHKGIIDPIASAHNRLLSDGAKTISKKLKIHYLNSSEIEGAEQIVHDEVSKILRPMKHQIAQIVKDL